ncbi:hypothetical protein, partial [Hominilimicola sp.]
IRYEGIVHEINDLMVQERFIDNCYKVIAIAPFHSCTIIEKNDSVLKSLQKKGNLKCDDIYELKKNIHMKRARDVSMRL